MFVFDAMPSNERKKTYLPISDVRHGITIPRTQSRSILEFFSIFSRAGCRHVCLRRDALRRRTALSLDAASGDKLLLVL